MSPLQFAFRKFAGANTINKRVSPFGNSSHDTHPQWFGRRWVRIGQWEDFHVRSFGFNH